MQSQIEKPTSNIVSLFGSKKSAAPVDSKVADESEPSSESFLDSMRKNMENQERLRKERSKANQSVLKSYRIKN